MDSFIDFLILLFSCAVGIGVIFLFQPQGEILRQVILVGTISVVYQALVWLHYEIF